MIKDTRLLIEFVAIAQAGSFTAAARQLGVAQPWLSTQMRKLEEQLAFTLFERTSRRVELTPRGQELLEIATPLSLQTRETLSNVAALAQRTTESIRIGIPPNGVNEVVAMIMREGNLAQSDCNVFIERGVSESLVDRLRQGVLDLAFIIDSCDKSDLDVQSVCQVFIDIIVKDRDPLSRKTLLEPDDLKGKTISAFPRALNPTLYDGVFGPLIDEGVTIGQFPELEINTNIPGLSWPQSLVRMAISTDIAEPSVQPGCVRIRLRQEQTYWLQLIRLKSNVTGRTRRTVWESTTRIARHSIAAAALT